VNGSVRVYDLNTLITLRDERSGVSNPNYRNQIARLQDASTYYFKEWYSDIKRPSIYTALLLDGGTRVDDTFIRPAPNDLPAFEDGILQTIDDQCLASFKRKLQGKFEEVKSLVPLAEVHEVRGLIKSIIPATKDFLKSAIAIKKSGKQVIRRTSDAWLIYQFGIRPTLSDIASITKAINARLANDTYVVKLSSTRTGSSKKLYDALESSLSVSFKHCHSRIERTIPVEVSYKGAFKVSLQAGADYSIADQFGIGLEEVPGLAWELTPWSWVVDYFTTTGAYFDDTFQIPSGSLIYLTRSVRIGNEDKVNLSFKLTYPDSMSWISNPGTTVCQFNRYKYYRTPLSSLPHAALRFRTVDEIGLGGIHKILNLAAVLGSTHR
jgi:hypothetical protein